MCELIMCKLGNQELGIEQKKVVHFFIDNQWTNAKNWTNHWTTVQYANVSMCQFNKTKLNPEGCGTFAGWTEKSCTHFYW